MSKRFLALAVFGAALIAGPASAATYNYSGTITDCNDAICSLVPVFTGDPVDGSITIDAGPGEAFIIDDTFADFSFLVGGVIPVEYPEPGGDGVIMTGDGTLDANGDFASGLLTGEFVGGTLGGLGGVVTIDLLTGAMEVTVGFGTVFVASVEGSFEQKVVPIPAAVWLMGSAMLGLVGLRRRKTA